MKQHEPVYYADYLQLDQLLSAQQLESAKAGTTAHDEMLFILVHQAYELWFKQILWEFDSVLDMLAPELVSERDLSVAVHRLERVTEIQRLLVQQLKVLETMTPLDFLDFRDLLIPASGFQSVQFRLIENKFGLAVDTRLSINNHHYDAVLADEHRDQVRAAEEAPTLLGRVNAWLERTPFTNADEFHFWREYRSRVEDLLEADRTQIMTNDHLTDQDKQRQLATQDNTRATFRSLFEPAEWAQLVADGQRRLTHRAFVAALMISLYGHEPALQTPHRLLTVLTDIDEGFALWRHQHALMVHRMIGGKIGTGGTSGHDYLRSAAETHRVFTDLFDLATFSLPRSQLPELPDEVRNRMGFVFTMPDR